MYIHSLFIARSLVYVIHHYTPCIIYDIIYDFILLYIVYSKDSIIMSSVFRIHIYSTVTSSCYKRYDLTGEIQGYSSLYRCYTLLTYEHHIYVHRMNNVSKVNSILSTTIHNSVVFCVVN